MRSPLVGTLAAVLALAGCERNEHGNLSASRTGDMSLGDAPRAPFDGVTTAACGPAGLTEDGDGVVLRRPYLQRLTAHGAWILWTADDTPTASVRISTRDGQIVTNVDATVDERASLPRGRQYVARIDGLEPHTTYCYEIVDGDRVLQAPTGFTTAPAPGSQAPVRFVTMGDLGKQSGDQRAVLEQIRTVPFDFLLINGDVAYDDGRLAEIESNFFDVYADVLQSFPVFAASGNHDYRTSDAAPFLQSFAAFPTGEDSGRWYSFDWGSVHIAVLDTERIGSEQARWLDEDLTANELPWTIVIGHRPPYSSGHHGSSAGMQSYFVPVFEKHQVDVVFAGHDHNYERAREIRGVDYIVSGAGGRGTRSVGESSFTAFAEEVSHFVYASVEPDGLHLWAIDAAGKVFDTRRIPPS